MNTKNRKNRRGCLRLLIVSVAASLFLAPLILSGETGYGPSAHPVMDIASADQGKHGSAAGSEEETPQDVEEATKNLHETGIAQDVNVFNWRLDIEGDKVGKPLSLSYRELKNMEMVKKEVTLVCPGFFTDVAVWEGVPLMDILQMAEIKDDYKKVHVEGLDGYRSVLHREEMENHLIFLALKVNGVTLPKEHGYPIRLVAEDVTGGKWVKWIDSIEVK